MKNRISSMIVGALITFSLVNHLEAAKCYTMVECKKTKKCPGQITSVQAAGGCDESGNWFKSGGKCGKKIKFGIPLPCGKTRAIVGCSDGDPCSEDDDGDGSGD